MVVPVVIIAVGVYFFFSPLRPHRQPHRARPGAHRLAAPFVVITVLATLQGFDPTLCARRQPGRPTDLAFRRVILPLIVPGVLSGALFAFATSFDEVVVALFLAGPEQRTLPRQMFDGLRENISPTITAAATLLIVLSVLLLATVELLRRRGRRLQAAQIGAG